MDNVSLRDIEAIARLESAKMQHYYVGVEHLFIALTKLDGGVAATIFEQGGQSPRYLRYATRELAARGDDRRYWPGYKTSPRAEKIMARAQALIDSGTSPDERALLIAILEENDSIPIRAMLEGGVDVVTLLAQVRDWSGQAQAQVPLPTITGGDWLSNEERPVLQLMFQKYEEVVIDHIFQEGFSGSTVMLVRPRHADGRADAEVVVKIADRQSILWEKKRYDSFVRDTLPPTTARIESDPALPEKSLLGGLKYTFVRLRGNNSPVNLYEFVSTHTMDDVARFLRESLYDGFRQAWWGHRGHSRTFRFPVWQEYDHLMPPALVLQALSSDGTMASNMRTLHPLDEWSRHGGLHPGELVELENFTAQKVKRAAGIVQLTAGAAPEAINRASRIDVQGLDLSVKTYFRGELVRKIPGRVLQTRNDILQQQVQALEPNFNIMDEYIPFGAGKPGLTEWLPNPLRRYSALLELRITGRLSTIHGDLHSGNILIGSGNDAWLIDFEWTREGHTLFDWAVLEVSMMLDHITPLVGPEWDSIWRAMRIIDGLNRKGELVDVEPGPLAEAFKPIVEIRRIAGELLAEPGKWLEYHVALSLCALRVISWTNRSLAARRLAYLASAVAMGGARDRSQSQTGGDLTEMTTDLT